jgi:hypothetical protein
MRHRARSGSAAPLRTQSNSKTAAGKNGSQADMPVDESIEDENENEEDMEDDYGTADFIADTETSNAEKQKKYLSSLMNAFTPEQYARYSAYRRTNLRQAAIRKLANYAFKPERWK